MLYNELLQQGYNIFFCWIPSHVGLKANENAGAAAKQAH